MTQSPLLLMILKLMRVGLLFCAGATLAIFAIEMWKSWFLGAGHEARSSDIGFLAVLAAVLAGALLLLRAVTREIRKMESIARGNSN